MMNEMSNVEIVASVHTVARALSFVHHSAKRRDDGYPMEY